MKGDNNEFKVGVPIDPLPVTRSTLTEKLYLTFTELVQNGTIKIGLFSDDINQKISQLRDRL